MDRSGCGNGEGGGGLILLHNLILHRTKGPVPERGWLVAKSKPGQKPQFIAAPQYA